MHSSAPKPSTADIGATAFGFGLVVGVLLAGVFLSLVYQGA
jgi:hypothetical protein